MKKNLFNILFIWIFSFGLILAINFKVYAEGTDLVEISMPNEVIKLYEPINIVSKLYYEDGGSSKYVVRDSKGKEIHIFIDRSIANESRGKPHYMTIEGVNVPKTQEGVIHGILDNCVNSIREGDYRGYIDRGKRNQSRGKFDKAIADYSKAIKINPNYDYAYYIRAYTYLYYIKDYNKAWIDVHKAQELGYKFRFGFLADLKKASGRER